MKTGIYARVSTTRQETENQIFQMRKYCQEKGHDIIRIYKDEGVSGARANKPEYEEMLQDARRRKFELLLFWSLDRFSREGAFKTLSKLKYLDDIGIKWRSYSQPYLDTTAPFGEAIISIFSDIAKQERLETIRRIKASYQRKKAKGEKWGREKIPLDITSILEKRSRGLSLRRIAELEGCSYNTIRNMLKKHWKTGLDRRASK